MQEKEILKKLNELKENEKWETLMNINNECASYNGSTDDIYYNDEYFFEIFFPNNVMEAVRATQFGDYRFNDDCITFDGYGNLETFNLYSIKDYIDLDEMAYQIAEESDIYENVEMYLDS